MLRFLTAGIVLLCAAQSATADNLIQNSDFATDMTGWGTLSPPPPGSIVEFDSANGSPAAGSARLSIDTSLGQMQFVVNGASQCVSVVGTLPPWNFGGRLRVASNTGDGVFGIRASFLSSDCDVLGGNSITLTAAAGASVAGVEGSYTQYALSVLTDPMPGGSATRSVLLSAFVQANTGVLVVNADKLYFGLVGTTPVGLTGFDVR
jgi:hypothetical protein